MNSGNPPPSQNPRLPSFRGRYTLIVAVVNLGVAAILISVAGNASPDADVAPVAEVPATPEGGEPVSHRRLSGSRTSRTGVGGCLVTVPAAAVAWLSVA